MTEDSLKEKIKKLLALASSANENEAAAAMGMAQELLIRHKLTMADLPDNEVPHEEVIKDEDPLFAAGRIHQWKSQLANLFATYNNCRLVKYTGARMADGKRGTKLVIFGRPSDIDIVRYLLAYSITTLTNFARIPCMDEGHSYKQSWFLGAVTGIQEKLRESKIRAQEGASQFALVKVENQLKEVDSFIRGNVGKLRKGTGGNTKINYDAYQQGHKVGRNFDLGDAKRLGRKDTLRIR